MGTVPRQESVPNGSMHHREPFKMALLICLIFSARARAARRKNKNMIRPLARIFLRGFLYHSSARPAAGRGRTPYDFLR
jgi:hypothetical protein